MPPKKKAATSAGVRTHVLGEEVLTTDHVAHDLTISVRTVVRAIHAGQLQARQLGQPYLLTRAAVRAWWDGLPWAEAGQRDEDASGDGLYPSRGLPVLALHERSCHRVPVTRTLPYKFV